MSAPATVGRAEIDAALLLLARMGITPQDLLATKPARGPAPTFAEYVPVVAAAVPAGSRKAYGSYWNRVLAVGGSAHRRRDPIRHPDAGRSNAPQHRRAPQRPGRAFR